MAVLGARLDDNARELDHLRDLVEQLIRWPRQP
jgi:hypothetical protein